MTHAYLAGEGGAGQGRLVAIVTGLHLLSLCAVIIGVSHRVHELHELFCISALLVSWLGW